MTRRSKKSRRTLDVEKGAPESPCIRRILPFFDVLEEDQIVSLEAQVDWILQDVGLAFRDDPEALRLWETAGATVAGDLVKAPADWIRDLCAGAPSQFTQLARNPERSVTMGGKHQVFAPVYGSPFVRDLKKGRRYGDLEALENLVRLTYMHPNLHHGGFVTCEP
ncbi:MAG: trimethylamine methyltransferase, partial [Granulosicoccus sp.]|nr:trimethylamine methyltransferase [Granulosicoccus sp.]